MGSTVYPTYLTGQRLTADLLTSGQTLNIIKAADTSRTTNVTPAADPDLVVTLAANRTYLLNSVIVYQGDAAGDMKGGITVPASGTIFGTVRAQGTTASSTAGSIVTDLQSGGTSFGYGCLGAGTNMTALTVAVITTGVGGTLGFSWSQVTSSAVATIIKAGSFIALTPVA